MQRSVKVMYKNSIDDACAKFNTDIDKYQQEKDAEIDNAIKEADAKTSSIIDMGNLKQQDIDLTEDEEDEIINAIFGKEE